jgi:YVTN family beta-propeller protein
MKVLKTLLIAAISVSLVAGCIKDNDQSAVTDYSYGIYIVNEGSYGSANGSISYFNPDANAIYNGIFEAVNQRPLGDVVQSIAVVGDTTGYIVVNGSGKVEIVRLKDFKTSAAPIPVVYPRYFLQVSGIKGYLTAGSMQGWVYIINLTTKIISDSISVGYGPEILVRYQNHVLVANSGGWGVDSTISVLDITTDQVTSVIKVGKVPVDMGLDSDNKLWVYCKGYAEYNTSPPYELISQTDAIIQQIDPGTGHILWQQSVGKAGDYTATPPKFAVSKDGNHIYYLRPNGVYDIPTHNPVIPANVIIPGGFYGIDVNPSDGNIYLYEANFSGNGFLKIYDAAGNALAQGTVGIAPNGAFFNLK